MNKFKIHRSAFTLIEIMVALAVTAIALTALLRLHLISINLADRTDATAAAVLLAQSKIDEALARGFPELGSTAGKETQGPRQLTWKRQVTQIKPPALDETDLTPLRNIAVQVTWQQGRRQKSLKLSTTVAEGIR